MYGGYDMKLIVCTDKKGGMMYNRRRQSRDRVMMENLKRHVGDELVYISLYSESLFAGGDIKYRVADDPCTAACDGYVFIEDTRLPSPENVSELVVYNWCCEYPSDVSFDFDYSTLKRISKEKFAGYSHEKITKEVFRK